MSSVDLELFSYLAKTNYPPNVPGLPKCPHFTLIEICASLAGHGINSEEYCKQVPEARRDVGPLAGFDGIIFKPVSTCLQVRDKLDSLTTLFDRENLEPRDQIIRGGNLERWKKVIWRVSTAGNTGQENGHFRRIENPEDLSDEEVLQRVRSFLNGLKAITGPSLREMNPNIPASHTRAAEAQGCDLAPKREKIGKQYLK